MRYLYGISTEPLRLCPAWVATKYRTRRTIGRAKTVRKQHVAHLVNAVGALVGAQCGVTHVCGCVCVYDCVSVGVDRGLFGLGEEGCIVADTLVCWGTDAYLVHHVCVGLLASPWRIEPLDLAGTRRAGSPARQCSGCGKPQKFPCSTSQALLARVLGPSGFHSAPYGRSYGRRSNVRGRRR